MNDKPHQCVVCGKGFARACDVFRHVKIHGTDLANFFAALLDPQPGTSG